MGYKHVKKNECDILSSKEWNDISLEVERLSAALAQLGGCGGGGGSTQVQEAGLQNGWHNYGNTYNNAGFFKDSQGTVYLKGLVRSGNKNAIFTLPAGYRPAARELFWTCTNPHKIGRVDVLPDGRILPINVNNGWVSLDGLSFRSSKATGQEDWKAVGFQNGWRNYGASYNTGAFHKTKHGIVRLRGLVKSGNGNAIFTLPAGYRPDGRNLFLDCTNPNGAGRIDVLPDGRVLPVRVHSGWASLDGLFFRASGASGQEAWKATAFQNGWVNYKNSYNNGGYYKDRDGVVHLRGLVKSGNNHGIFTLPAGYRPAARQLFGVCRVC